MFCFMFCHWCVSSSSFLKCALHFAHQLALLWFALVDFSTKLYGRNRNPSQSTKSATTPTPNEKRNCHYLVTFIVLSTRLTEATPSNKMSKPFDYSKWDNIELSDDEEDVHPNIDRESWFRMKHRSRVEREDHEEKDKKRIVGEVREHLFVLLFSINPIMIH